MRRSLTIFIALAWSLFYTSFSFGAVTNTKHNLALDGGQATHSTDLSSTTCGFCHVAHGVRSNSSDFAPLWAVSNVSSSFTLYGGGTTLAGTTINTPGAASLMCLACHDGSIALGVIIKFGSETPATVVSSIPGLLTGDGKFSPNYADPVSGYSPYIGTDLRNDHPVGFTYPVGGYLPGGGYGPGGVPGITLLPSGTRLVGASGAEYPLYGGRVECATCHNPHGTTFPTFLRGASATLCQDCHDVK